MNNRYNLHLTLLTGPGYGEAGSWRRAPGKLPTRLVQRSRRVHHNDVHYTRQQRAEITFPGTLGRQPSCLRTLGSFCGRLGL